MAGHGLLHREHAGVYAVGHATQAPFARETSALLACGDRALLSHASAALVWGLMAEQHGPVDLIFADPGTGRRRAGIRVHRSMLLLDRDMRVHRQLPVTAPARTLLDLASSLDTRALERVLDEALIVRRIVRLAELRDIVGRANGHRGTGPLKQMLERRRRPSITHSEAERRCLELIRAAGLPEPQTQVRIGGYTVDLLWPVERVVFEIDGYAFHTSRSAFDRDRRKDIALKAVGHDANRLSRDQVMKEPYVTIAAIATAVARARSRL